MRIDSSGLRETIAKMTGVAARAHSIEPALKEFSDNLVTRIDNNYAASVNWDGSPFAKLKESTVRARIAKLPGTKKKNKKGKLTAASRTKRKAYESLYNQEAAAGLYSSIIKPLVDDGIMRNSNHVDPPDANSFEWSSIGYLGYHMAGTRYMEARNPTPFEWDGAEWILNEDFQKELNEKINNYILTGDV